jgi:GntR family carbon starvation induced transcriptional regulator
MARNGSARTLVDDVYAAIKADIVLGRLIPGQRLHLGDLCRAHEVSLSVVREAVTRLASEHLVQARPQQGFNVRALSVPDLLDLTRARIEIESLALRESVAVGDVAWEAELVGAHHRLAGATASPGETNYAWMRAHSEFHAALASACTSPLLKQIRQQLFDAAELYRYWSANLPKPRKKRNVEKEHKALLHAAISHDVDLCVELLTKHIQFTTERLLAARPETVEPVAT